MTAHHLAVERRGRPDSPARLLGTRKPLPGIPTVTLDDLVPGQRAIVRSFVQKGSAAPAEGSAAPAEGSAAPAEGFAAHPAEGSAGLAEGFAAHPAEGSAGLAEGSAGLAERSAAHRAERSALQRLSELGIVPGARLRLVRRAPFGDPLEIEVGRFHLALRRTDARRIEVELEERPAT